MVTIEKAKLYLRVDGQEEDGLIEALLSSSNQLVQAVARGQPTPEQEPVFDNATLYAVAYLYEHREDADHKELMLMLRALLFGVREEVF